MDIDKNNIGLSDESDLRDEVPELEYEDISLPLDFQHRTIREHEETFEHDFEQTLDEALSDEAILELPDEADLEDLEELQDDGG